MNRKIDLIWLTDSAAPFPAWSLGEVWSCNPSPQAIQQLTEQKLAQSESQAWFFWHSRLGLPNPQIVQDCLDKAGEVWHGGLALGMAGLPEILDFIHPTWTLNLDADANIEASSWRLSLESCLISLDVLRQLGGVTPEFTSLSAASLELGYRYIKWGVFMRHIPALVPENSVAIPPKIALEDELRFVRRHFGRKQIYWSIFRVLASGYSSPLELLAAWRKISQETAYPTPKPFQHHAKLALELDKIPQVSVLIPTIDRYPYLRTLLDQLRQQTIRPCEIIIVDQSSERDINLVEDFDDLPLNYIVQAEKGQCLARNAGLTLAKGDYILFIDDDDEIEPNLIEQHLAAMQRYQTKVSSGAAHEPESGALPEYFTYIRASDVFPTNNTLIRREVLQDSGLFDLAYNQGMSEDGDLGIRIYLNGTFMVYSPEISVLHHHAPSGGLRNHKARVITYAKSRQSLVHRRLPHITEIYLQKRYFSRRQVREAMWLRVFGTFAIRGNLGRKIAKLAVASIQLVDTLMKLNKAHLESEKLLKAYPQIPKLDEMSL